MALPVHQVPLPPPVRLSRFRGRGRERFRRGRTLGRRVLPPRPVESDPAHGLLWGTWSSATGEGGQRGRGMRPSFISHAAD